MCLPPNFVLFFLKKLSVSEVVPKLHYYFITAVPFNSDTKYKF